ncbi:MAG TPA: hypothetical protein VGH81_02590 [Rudaea sp.]|jgi:hypothetical protein
MSAAKKSSGDAAVQIALRERFPKPRASAAAYQFFVILASNAYLLYLVVAGRVFPVSLVASNVCELILLSVIAHLPQIPIPRSARLPDTDQGGILRRILVLGFALLWLSGVYSIGLMVDAKHLNVLAQFPGIFAKFESLNIVTPLLMSGSLALVGVIGDWSTWHRRGGLYVSEMAMSAAPKILTLVLAPIVSAICGFAFIRQSPEFAVIAWSGAYLAVKALSELGMFAWQCSGMPESATQGPSTAEAAVGA